MKLTINNIGKLKNAEVEINGITVIAGENNTGKSTVGKALWSIFNSFYKTDKQILNEKSKNIEEELTFINRSNLTNFQSYRNFREKIEKFVNEIFTDTDYFLKEGFLKEKIMNVFGDVDEKIILEISENVRKILKIPNRKVIEQIVQNRLITEFNNQVNNIYSNKLGEIKLEVKDSQYEVKLQNNEVIELTDEKFLNTEALYIDNPNIIDDVPTFFLDNSVINHKIHLINKLNNFKEENIIKDIIIKEKLEKVYEKLNDIMNGKFVKKNLGNVFYQKNKYEFNIKNLSMGLKTFAILKILLENNSLKEKGTIILDEPEIHLHPEWQVLFAELIVLLQKEFEMHILLTTHSPYFLKAIQVFSRKYEIFDKCKYYIGEIDGEESTIIDTTDNLENIFYKLTIPFENLMNEEEVL